MLKARCQQYLRKSTAEVDTGVLWSATLSGGNRPPTA